MSVWDAARNIEDATDGSEDLQRLQAEREAERKQRIRDHNVSSGMVQCSGCNCWFYDEPGNFCSLCT